MSDENPIAPIDRINLRCSALPRVALCPASAVPPAVKIDIGSEAAELGTAVHDWLADAIINGDPHFDQIAPAGIDTEEFQRLCRMAWSAWLKIEPSFRATDGIKPWTEYAIETNECCGVFLDGTADLVAIPNEDTILGLDWKSGWRDGDHEQQMRGYAWLAINESPLAQKVRWHVLSIRFGTVDVYEWTREELDKWWSAVVERVRSEPDLYRPSPEACGFCPRFCECPARATLIRASAVQILATEFAAIHEIAADMPPAALAQIVERGRMLEKAAKFAVDVVRAVVINAGGKIALEDGRVLQIKTTVQTQIDSRIALPLIEEKIGDRLPEVVTIGKGDLEKEIKALSPRGQKGKAVEEFLYELDRAGALSLKEIQKLEIVKETKEIANG